MTATEKKKEAVTGFTRCSFSVGSWSWLVLLLWLLLLFLDATTSPQPRLSFFKVVGLRQRHVSSDTLTHMHT